MSHLATGWRELRTWSADHRRGSRSNGSGRIVAACGGTSSTCASRASLGGRPSASTSSQDRGTKPYGSGVSRRGDLAALRERDFRLLFAAAAFVLIPLAVHAVPDVRRLQSSDRVVVG